MNILETILKSQNGAAVEQMAKSFGVRKDQAGEAVVKLLPVLMQGMKKNVASEGGLASLLSALNRGKHQEYIEEPSKAVQPEAIHDGNKILGHLLGSKEVSRRVAGAAAEHTDLSADMLKKMLPVVANMFMGSVSKQTASAGLPGNLSESNAPAREAQGLVSRLLDSDGDGSVADDLLGMAGKLFR